jgi:hypothetical protein
MQSTEEIQFQNKKKSEKMRDLIHVVEEES